MQVCVQVHNAKKYYITIPQESVKTTNDFISFFVNTLMPYNQDNMRYHLQT